MALRISYTDTSKERVIDGKRERQLRSRKPPSSGFDLRIANTTEQAASSSGFKSSPSKLSLGVLGLVCLLAVIFALSY